MPKSPGERRIGAAVTVAVVGFALAGAARAQLPTPGACKPGFVWREAVSGDGVCVTPRVRDATARDNRQSEGRRERRGGVPPDACRPGYVWREAVPGDHVCVTPAVRAAAARDNQLAPTRSVAVVAAPTPGIAAPGPGTAGPPSGPRPPAADRRVVDTACDTYARRARKQFQLTAGMSGCAVRASARWQDDYDAHYRWCMASPQRARGAEEQARDRWLVKCGAVVKLD